MLLARWHLVPRSMHGLPSKNATEGKKDRHSRPTFTPLNMRMNDFYKLIYSNRHTEDMPTLHLHLKKIKNISEYYIIIKTLSIIFQSNEKQNKLFHRAAWKDWVSSFQTHLFGEECPNALTLSAPWPFLAHCGSGPWYVLRLTLTSWVRLIN